ncbi:MmcQ/YjbR family DNA-binding protein [Escherichia coli]
MDKQSLHETAKRPPLSYPLSSFAGLFGPEFDVFKIGGKIFMLSSELRGVPFINLKSDPQKSLLNQQIYPSIKPWYHMNKKHWISVYPGEEISEALLRDLINDSWNLVVDGLAKRDQKRVRPG